MNSRERIRTTLNHQEPDKVPIDLGGNVSGIHIKTYKRLLEYLGIEDENIQYYDKINRKVGYRMYHYHITDDLESLLRERDKELREHVIQSFFGHIASVVSNGVFPYPGETNRDRHHNEVLYQIAKQLMEGAKKQYEDMNVVVEMLS